MSEIVFVKGYIVLKSIKWKNKILLKFESFLNVLIMFLKNKREVINNCKEYKLYNILNIYRYNICLRIKNYKKRLGRFLFNVYSTGKYNEIYQSFHNFFKSFKL